MGDDGIYHKGEQRLATIVPVRDDQPQWIRFVQLLAVQVADCGIEIIPRADVPRDDWAVALDWPLKVPPAPTNRGMRFSAGWTSTPDPDFVRNLPLERDHNPYQSRTASTTWDMPAQRAIRCSIRGVRRTTSEERARIYREYQRVVAEDRPVLFAWSAGSFASLGATASSRREGPLATDTSTWWWRARDALRSARPTRKASWRASAGRSRCLVPPRVERLPSRLRRAAL